MAKTVKMAEMAEMEEMERMENKDSQVYRDLQDSLVPRGPVVVGWSIQDGGGQCVLTYQEPHSCTVEELEEATFHIVEVEQTTCACLMTHSISLHISHHNLL